jgi:hypothetical protein
MMAKQTPKKRTQKIKPKSVNLEVEAPQIPPPEVLAELER